MDWSDVGGVIKDIAGVGLHALGTVVGGPLGGEIADKVAGALGVSATPDAVSQALKTDPDAAVKLAKLAQEQAIQLATLAAQTAEAEAESRSSVIESVNKTIRSEAVGASWLQRNAQPICKLSSVGCIVGIYFVLPLAHVAVPAVPADAWIMIGAILGVASWHDGVAKRNAISGTDTSALGGVVGKLMNRSK